ncbi:helix-turn-helix domain-containing protein [Gordonibacter sp.]|uniref:helix-turn-helix domain-containing protein n=1 Tax=Gordonibacter sp. TaxID=1968902 RepID=UPI003FA58BE9
MTRPSTHQRLSLAALPDVLTTEQCAEFLGVHENTIRSHCNSGELKAEKIGVRWFVPKSALGKLVGND